MGFFLIFLRCVKVLESVCEIKKNNLFFFSPICSFKRTPHTSHCVPFHLFLCLITSSVSKQLYLTRFYIFRKWAVTGRQIWWVRRTLSLGCYSRTLHRPSQGERIHDAQPDKCWRLRDWAFITGDAHPKNSDQFKTKVDDYSLHKLEVQRWNHTVKVIRTKAIN